VKVKIPRPIKISCQHAHRLMSERMDHPLPAVTRARLWLHLKFCDACVRVGRQMDLMREAIRRLGP
jgi:hypothetical protein